MTPVSTRQPPNFDHPNFDHPNFDHIAAMTDGRGTFEHAEFAHPRPEHGYCTDDMARLLVVATREPRPTATVRRLAEISLRFLGDAQGMDGDYRNRMSVSGHWSGPHTVEDCWGRSIWGLGTAAARSDVEWIRQTAAAQFERAAQRRSPWSRAMAFATIGAAEFVTANPHNQLARALLADAADAAMSDDGAAAVPGTPPGAPGPSRALGAPGAPTPSGVSGASVASGWPWPESRLRYANAVLPEAMIAAGAALGRPEVTGRGLDLLAWLLARETVAGHLSVTPVGGAGVDDVGPRYDQQPIEVAAMADACARAAGVDDDQRWADGVAAAVAWFLGDNDGHQVMCDRSTGGGFDGLEPGGANRNEGAESTLALLSTLQHGRNLVPARGRTDGPDSNDRAAAVTGLRQ